jgi:hypothetical protein
MRILYFITYIFNFIISDFNLIKVTTLYYYFFYYKILHHFSDHNYHLSYSIYFNSF